VKAERRAIITGLVALSTRKSGATVVHLNLYMISARNVVAFTGVE